MLVCKPFFIIKLETSLSFHMQIGCASIVYKKKKKKRKGMDMLLNPDNPIFNQF